MSDINIILDGVLAFIVAAALSLLLLAAVTVCLAYGLIKARGKREPLRREPVFPHILGMLISLVCLSVVMLFLLATEWMPRPHTINRWLDNWVWLWALALLSLWPLSAHIWKKRQVRGPIQS
jgi:hypothetical protein